MSLIRKLASDTAAYGISSILARLINFFFGFLIIKYISPAEYGVYGKFYAYAGFFLVLLTHGMETAFFRHYNKEEYKEKAFATAFASIFIITLFYVVFSYVFSANLSAFVEEPKGFVLLFTWMMVFDVLGALPFASLRATHRPIRFAALKIINIIIFISFNIFFFIILPRIPGSGNWHLDFGLPNVVFVFLSNLLASAATLILLLPQLKLIKKGFDAELYKRMLRYALPIMIVGFAGMINEMLDRAMMTKLLPGTKEENDIQLGIYSFNYKFSMLMTLFLQAYRYAAEPFFFAQAKHEDSKKVYADTMKYFIICGCVIFLLITLNIPLLQFMLTKYSPSAKHYFEGAKVIPILLMANLCLGIYFNISTWYKITDKTHIGAMVSIFGAIITLILNYLWIPVIGYMGSAWATLICYFLMVIVGYILEMKFYPIRYDLSRIFFYIFTALILFFLTNYLYTFYGFSVIAETLVSALAIISFISFAYFKESRKKI
ncbi:MAG: polysaccharide biosynthesis protein [Bacteroidota bacterium]|nr:polysaccharide biosynthesis protein [Bacteroidota bacterium]